MKSFVINIYILFLLGCGLVNVKLKREIKQLDFRIEINQILSGTYTQDVFIISGDKLLILQKYIKKNGRLKIKKIYSKQINATILHEIKHIIDNLMKLENEYIKASLDGICWEINVQNEKTCKKITIENYSVKEINTLFNIINKMIPDKKPKLIDGLF